MRSARLLALIASLMTCAGAAAEPSTRADHHAPGSLAARTSLPEPGTLLLLGIGVAGLAHWGRRRQR